MYFTSSSVSVFSTKSLLFWIQNAGTGYSMLGTVDSYGHLIVTKLDTDGKGKRFLLDFFFVLSLFWIMWRLSRIYVNK